MQLHATKRGKQTKLLPATNFGVYSAYSYNYFDCFCCYCYCSCCCCCSFRVGFKDRQSLRGPCHL